MPNRPVHVAVFVGVAIVGMAIFAAIGGLRGSGPAMAQTAPTPTASALPTGPAPTPSAGPGRDLYLRDCAYCHGAQGEGSISGPPLVGVGAASADFMLSTGRMPIPKPEDQPERKPPVYTPEQIRGLVGFVAGFQDWKAGVVSQSRQTMPGMRMWRGLHHWPQ